MQHLYTQCKEMMDVSDQQIAVYKEARLRMEKEGSGAAAADDSRNEKILDLQKKIEEGRKKLKLERGKLIPHSYREVSLPRGGWGGAEGLDGPYPSSC